MYPGPNDPIKTSRDAEVVAVPAGHTLTLPAGTEVVVTQALGGSYTLLVPSYGGLFRLANRDADAIGKEAAAAESAGETVRLSPEELEKRIWEALKTCYDPEIPVNIVDLGLIYDMQVLALTDGTSRIEVKMTLTAQGCGMGTSIAADARYKLMEIPGVSEADVLVVWDPPWTPEKISPEGRTLLGIV
jgi:probable FeS assembly SUF system protein SufT